MQILINLSRFIFLVVLGLSLLTIWYINNNTDVTTLNPLYTEAFRYTESADTTDTTRDSVRVPEVKNKYAAPTDYVWHNISHDLKLDHKADSPEVKKEIRKILADKKQFESILKAAGPYIYFIHEKTDEYNLPAEIALIPIIESEFNPYDHSTKGATGLWQLMPGTAHELGIQVKAGYDGRRNVIQSTRAALAYFRDLGVQFKGNWYLAIAAYDAGQGKIASLVRHAGSTNYNDLKLSRETKEYVPKWLAVAEIIKHPEKYNVHLPAITNEPYFAQLHLATPMNLTQLAALSGINMNVLQTLNPDYKNNKVPSKAPYILLVPADDEARVKKKLGGKIIA